MYLSRHPQPCSLFDEATPAVLSPRQRLLMIEVGYTGEAGQVHVLDPAQADDLMGMLERGACANDWLEDLDRPMGHGRCFPGLSDAFASMNREGLMPAVTIALPKD